MLRRAIMPRRPGGYMMLLPAPTHGEYWNVKRRMILFLLFIKRFIMLLEHGILNDVPEAVCAKGYGLAITRKNEYAAGIL